MRQVDSHRGAILPPAGSTLLKRSSFTCALLLVTVSGLAHAAPAQSRARPLPLHEPLFELGVPVPAPLTLDVPRYDELLSGVMQRMGWAPEEFTGYRLRMSYPPLPAAFFMRYELPLDD